MRDRFNILEALDKIDEDSKREDWELWGNTQAGADTDLFNSPKFQELVNLLLQSPILVSPTLNWVRYKQAAIARAQLETLYSQEELEEMYENAAKE